MAVSLRPWPLGASGRRLMDDYRDVEESKRNKLNKLRKGIEANLRKGLDQYDFAVAYDRLKAAVDDYLDNAY